MSAPTRDEHGRFVKSTPAPPPFVFPGATIRDSIPGSRGLPVPDGPVVAAGITWEPATADVWAGSPIGAALAAEYAARTDGSTP